MSLLLGYGKTVSHVVIGLKTAKGTKQLKLDPSIYESLQKEKVEVGDVIYIEANSGAVKVSTMSLFVLLKSSSVLFHIFITKLLEKLNERELTMEKG